MALNVMRFQIGKAGVTPGIIESLELAFKNHKVVRISALKASGRDRNSIASMAESLVSGLKTPCDYRIIGFTIILIKKGKAKSPNK
jgi:RNA-binding protein YhbY